MKVHEPMTFATDCGLAAWCAWLGYLLSSGAPSLHPEVINWWMDANGRSVVVSSESIGDYSYVLNSAFVKGVPVRVSTILSSLMPVRTY